MRVPEVVWYRRNPQCGNPSNVFATFLIYRELPVETVMMMAKSRLIRRLPPLSRYVIIGYVSFNYIIDIDAGSAKTGGTKSSLPLSRFSILRTQALLVHRRNVRSYQEEPKVDIHNEPALSISSIGHELFGRGSHVLTRVTLVSRNMANWFLARLSKYSTCSMSLALIVPWYLRNSVLMRIAASPSLSNYYYTKYCIIMVPTYLALYGYT